MHTGISAGVLALVAAGLATWYVEISKRAEEVGGRLRQVEKQEKSMSATVEETVRVRKQLEGSLAGMRKATLNEGAEALGPALRSIAASVEDGIELAAVAASAEPAPAPGWRLRVEGTAGGLAPRALADRCRWRLQEELGRRYEVTQECKFERLDYNADAGAKAGGRKAFFTISAAIIPAPPATPAKEAAR